MQRHHHRVVVLLFTLLPLLLITACSPSNTPATTKSTTSEIQTAVPTTTYSASTEVPPPVVITMMPSVVASATASSRPRSNYEVVVIVDSPSAPVTREQAQSVIDEGSKVLRPFSPFGLEMVGFVEDSNGGTMLDLANRYIASHGEALPDGIVIFSFGDDSRASSGGYSFSVAAPPSYNNAFVPLASEPGQISVAVVNLQQKYMPCGYGTSTMVQSSISLGGECRNQPGTACVQNNGYSICANAVDNLYASTPIHFVSSILVRELLQPFAPGGEKDNYATAECSARMGYPAGFFDLQESQYYNDLCPFVYDNFVKSYQP